MATKYAGYIDKQNEDVVRSKSLEELSLADGDLDYDQVTALSFEVRQKLNQHRPQTLGTSHAYLWV